jgi:hypothetical protein
LNRDSQIRWRTLTFLAAFCHDRFDAPCVIDGPIHGESFLAYVRQSRVPALKPGNVVIIDNLGSHKGKAVRHAIRSAGAKLFFLPSTVPTRDHDRAGLCQAQDPAAQGRRTNRRGNLNRTSVLLQAFTSQECANYLKNAGYVQDECIRLPMWKPCALICKSASSPHRSLTSLPALAMSK